MLSESGTHRNKQAHHGRNSPSDVHDLQPFSEKRVQRENAAKKSFTK
jgi:hypothetical protein